MSDALRRDSDAEVVQLYTMRHRTGQPVLSGGDGGGTFDDMEPRVAALEKGMTEIQAVLKELRDGQHAAALSEATRAGDLNTRLAEFSGKLTNLDTKSDGLRRDLDKLPTEYGVAKILVFVVGGLAGVAALLKIGLPALIKAFS